MHPVQYTVLDYAYRADYSCTFTMHVQKKIKLAVGVPYAIMHQNQWFFIGTQIARELENY